MTDEYDEDEQWGHDDGWVKLYGSILDSSVWAEPLATRMVWITMLLTCDMEGRVRGSESALARRANVTVPECRKALATLAAPDLESQSKEWGGRRIEAINRGWLVLNYKKYREKRSKKQVENAKRQAAFRARNKGVTDNKDNSYVAPTVDVTVAVGGAVTTTSGGDVENVVDDVEELDHIRLVVAANLGLEAHPKRPQKVPRILPGMGSTVEAAEKLEQARVPLKFAESAIYEIGKGHRSDTEIRSLLYFVPGVLRRWQEAKQVVEMASASRPADLPTNEPHRPTTQEREAARERERADEIEKSRRERIYVKARAKAVAEWAKTHPAEYSTIVEDVKKEMGNIGPMSGTMTSAVIDMTCVERYQCFPAIEDWKE